MPGKGSGKGGAIELFLAGLNPQYIQNNPWALPEELSNLIPQVRFTLKTWHTQSAEGNHDYVFILVPDSLLAAQYVIETLDGQPLASAGHQGARCDFSQNQQRQFQAAGIPEGDRKSVV